MASPRCISFCSPARTFLTLARPSGTAALDFLIPPATRAAQRAPVQRRCLGTSFHDALVNRTIIPRRIPTLDHPSSSNRQPRAAPFSTTTPLRATRAIFNPQQDEDGNEMMLEITPRAAKRLSRVMAKDSNPHLALRIQVESGGCHGFQYIFGFVTLPPSLPSASGTTPAPAEAEGTEPTVRPDDTIFAFTPEDTTASEVAGEEELTLPKIVLDGPSLEILKGGKVDYAMELIGSSFKIVDIPGATSSCGCGTSFDIKI